MLSMRNLIGSVEREHGASHAGDALATPQGPGLARAEAAVQDEVDIPGRRLALGAPPSPQRPAPARPCAAAATDLPVLLAGVGSDRGMLRVELRRLFCLSKVLDEVGCLARLMEAASDATLLTRASHQLDTDLTALRQALLRGPGSQALDDLEARCRQAAKRVDRQLRGLTCPLLQKKVQVGIDSQVRTQWKWVEIYGLAKLLAQQPAWRQQGAAALEAMRQAVCARASRMRRHGEAPPMLSQHAEPRVQAFMAEPVVQSIFLERPPHAHLGILGQHQQEDGALFDLPADVALAPEARDNFLARAPACRCS